jgi:hypothetical protein
MVVVGAETSSVCLTFDGRTLSVRLSQGAAGGAPVFEAWRDGGPNWGWVDVAACPAEYALAVAFGGPTTCIETNDRIV